MSSLPPSPPPPPPPPAAPARKTHRKLWIAAGVVAALAVIGALLGKPPADKATVAASTSPPAATTSSPAPSSPSPEPSPPPAPKPDGKFTSSCDYLLGNFTSNTPQGFRFIAGAKLINTGNVGITVHVIAKWQQLGTHPVIAEKDAQVPYGANRRVQFTVLVNGDQIDLIQAMPYNDECSVTAKITGTYSRVRSTPG